MKAKIVNEWFATNPTEYQKRVIEKYVHRVMFIFFIMGFIFCIAIFMLLGVLIA